MFCLDIMLPIISRGLLQIKINQKKANKAFTSICPTAVGCLGSKPASLYKINPIIEEICNYLMTSAHFGNVGCVSYHAHICLLWAHKHEVLYKLLDGVVNIFKNQPHSGKGGTGKQFLASRKRILLIILMLQHCRDKSHLSCLEELFSVRLSSSVFTKHSNQCGRYSSAVHPSFLYILIGQ